MSEIYTFKGNNSLSRDKLNYTSGSFKNIHYGDIHTKFMQHFHADIELVPYINDGESHSTIRSDNYCMAGDMVFADASEDITDIGKAIEIIDAGSIPLVSGLHTILARPKKDYFILGFGAYLFSSEWIRKQIQRESQGVKVLGLSPARLGNVILHYPQALDEQQKIADCLASIDELITLESQKLDTLKRHKKGLMQQLFPAEGETAPRLRFPEFRDAEGWSAPMLAEISKLIDERVGDRKLTPISISAGIGFVPQVEKFGRDISGEQYRRYTVIRDGDFVYNKGNSIRFPQGCIYDLQGWGEVAAPNVFICFRLKEGYENAFFRQYFEKNIHGIQLKKYITSGARSNGLLNISKETFFAIRIPLPSKAEQQKIADCLGSLDDVIAMQARKVDALKTHKKGLMQQLFPRMDEVGA